MVLSTMWDLRYIWQAIRNDTNVLAGLNLTEASSVQISNTIIKRKVQPNQLAADQRRLCIYFVPSRSGLIEIASENLIQIDCHIPSGASGSMDVAHQVLDDCWKAVKDKNLNGVQLEWEGFLGDIYSFTSHYSAAIRLKYSTVVY